MWTPLQRLFLAVLVLLFFIYGGQYTLHWLKNAGKAKPSNVIAFGLVDDTPPFCFYDDQNKLVGINIDVATEIARRIGKRAHIESVSFNRLTSGLMTHQYDIVSIGSVTPDRARVVRYIQPHERSADVLLVHPNLARLKSLDDFKGQRWRIGVYNGTSYIKLLQDKGLSRNMIIYPNQRDVFLAFYKHRVDAIIMSEDVAHYIKRRLDPSITILAKKVRTNRHYAFAVRKEDLHLWRQVNNTVHAMLADGTFDRIMHRWIPDNPPMMRKEAS